MVLSMTNHSFLFCHMITIDDRRDCVYRMRKQRGSWGMRLLGCDGHLASAGRAAVQWEARKVGIGCPNSIIPYHLTRWPQAFQAHKSVICLQSKFEFTPPPGDFVPQRYPTTHRSTPFIQEGSALRCLKPTLVRLLYPLCM